MITRDSLSWLSDQKTREIRDGEEKEKGEDEEEEKEKGEDDEEEEAGGDRIGWDGMR